MNRTFMKMPKIKRPSGIRRLGVGIGGWAQGGPQGLSKQDFQFKIISLNHLDKAIPNGHPHLILMELDEVVVNLKATSIIKIGQKKFY